MSQRLSKKEYYYAVTPKRNKLLLVLWIIADVLNLVGIALGPASVLGLIACIVCGIGVKMTFSKWWGISLLAWGVIQFGLIYVVGGVMPWATLFVGAYVFQILNNLDKSYAEYLKTGELPDTKGY